MINKELRDRLMKNSTIKDTDVLNKSILFSERDCIPTPIPIMNVALSGKFSGGLIPGLIQLAGPSKHFKTAFGLLLISSFLAKYSDGIILFYDSEFGTPEHYFDTFNIPKDQVIHTPITDIEALKHDITTQLKGITREDHVLIFIDSIGNVASIKEVTDAEEGKSTADMTRAKQLKSLFRIVTPHLTMKNIPLVVVNHVYKEIGLYPKDIVSGGTGSYLSSNDIWIIGRQQDKDGTELKGYDFIINIEKSRTVKEKSKIPVSVSFEEGIFKWSGLFDNAIEAGVITSEKKGWYNIQGVDKGFRRDELESNDDFWNKMLQNQSFVDFVEKKYQLSSSNMFQDTKTEIAE